MADDEDDVMARLRAISARKFEKPTLDRAEVDEFQRTLKSFTETPKLPEYVSPLDDPKFKAQMDEDLAAIRQSKREAIEREQAMIASLGTLAELAVREHEDAADRERVAAKRHAESMEIARSGAFWAKFAGIAGVVAIIATIVVAM